ncbi:MAG: HD domain-containing phosphohydrolase [Candidatus Anammoxibacter sp.]
MGKPKILIADDEEMIRTMVEDVLTPVGYDVIQACDGLDAMKKIKEFSPDVILTDVNMPNMNGFELLKQLRENEDTKTIPVVMVTALNEIKMRVKAIELGVDDFLGKPMDILELRARIKSLLKVKAYNDHLRDYQKELETEVEKRTKEVKLALIKATNASYETIYILSRAAEYRDEDTGAHILRVSHYAGAIARKLGKSDDEVEIILYGAPLHDVGKIGIPDNILMKPGKLSPDEFKIMKGHVGIGAQILKGSASPFIKMGEEIALSHHEKWDGSGYPKGLKGEDIPLSGRIIALADVFDALTTKRPYKEAFPVEKATKIIREGRGTHFDPAVMDAFFDIFDEILEIRGTYKD